jgi:Spy/CpxP family protein refolding chaperone
MKHSNRFTLAMLAIIGALLFTTVTEAQFRGGDRERGPRSERRDRVLLHERLNLTEEQEKHLTQIRMEFQKRMIDSRGEVQKNRLDIRSEMDRDQSDMTKVEELVKRQEGLRTEQHLARVKHWMAINEILTPEQREIWKEHRRGFGDFGDRRGSGRRIPRGRW